MKPNLRAASIRSGCLTHRIRCSLVWLAVVAGCEIGVQAVELPDFTSSLFTSAGQCAFCHDPWTTGGGRRRDGGAPLASDWQATMMAQSFKDPLWRAVMEAEVEENPDRQRFIENKCQTCHAPVARTQAYVDGTNELTFAAARPSPLAGEGVGCTLCHQIQANGLGTDARFTGQYRIGTERHIFGPYDDVLTMPMQRHVDYTPMHGPHTQDSALCATCHTLFTPILDAAGNVQGEFPEQVPYLEWRQSDFARQGQHCQDCHMPRLDEAVKVSSRPPWLEPRAPFWKHQFVGGNAFMLTLFADHARPLEANADAEQFEAMIRHTRAQLQRAAGLQLSARREADQAIVDVTVENRTGHKFPTGHPYRRAWLHVRVRDARGRTLFESGAVDKAGALPGLVDGYTPHRDCITAPDQTQIYQSVMGDPEGAPTWSLLRGARYLKDNRIPPRGFRATGPHAASIAVRGEATTDGDFHADEGGRDTVHYCVPLIAPEGRLRVEVELFYQSVPPEAIGRLRHGDGAEAKSFARIFTRQPNRPEVVARAQGEF
jgi:hypothetical protein